MDVFVVMGGCTGDEHIIAIYHTEKKANRRKLLEQAETKGLNPWVERWTISK